MMRSLSAAPLLLAAAWITTGAQNPNTMRPDQSTAKAREVIEQSIQALGGQSYLNVRDFTREGRLALYTKDDLSGFNRIWDYTILPDKNRTEYYTDRNIIEVFNGEKGWTMDRAGVEDIPADRVKDFQDGMKRDLDILFRTRLKEDGLILRYAGSDLMDLKQVEWVEVIDRDRRQFRIAFDKNTHWPIRTVYNYRDPETRERIEEIEYYSNYRMVQGVQTPMSFSRDRNGRQLFKVFFETWTYNTGLAESLFSRESLEQTFASKNKKKKK
jgi:hypothetical protein